MKRYIVAALAALAVLLPSCVKDETYPYASVSKVSNTDAVGPIDVTVTATVSALVPVTVKLLYTAGSASEASVDMVGSGETYTGVIPGQPVGTVVKYHVEATTTAGSMSSNEMTYTVAEKPAEPQTLFINEVNCGTKQFEIYNASDKAVDIAGYVFKKDDSGDWEVPAGKGNIPAKGFIVYTAKNPDLNEGPSFGISGTKGFKLTMLKDGEIVDEIDNSATLETFQTVPDGFSLSRKTDGGSEWVLVEGGTMGYSNGAEPVVEIKLYVNEVSCGNKQFEIYNASSKDVDIAGYCFTKDDGDPWVVPAGKGNIPAKGFIVYTAKNPDINEGPSFGISGTKGFKLCMYSSETPSAETLVDMIDNSKSLDTFMTVEDSETIGRKTDGAAEIVIFSEGTIGSSNNNGTVK
jgi:hypothetical protein